MKLFTKLAKLNMDHYNNHPVSHLSILAAYTAVVGVAIPVIAYAAGKDYRP